MLSSSFLCLCLALTVMAKIDPTHGVLGFSSGAYFAVQYQLSYSSQLRGAAVFAGGPYYCTQFLSFFFSSANFLFFIRFLYSQLNFF
jgi:hypothetical protein